MNKILVVEDELNIQKVIKDYFEAEGFNVDLASDGYEGLYKFNENIYDLIILDVMMPEIDGFSVCKRIRKTSDIPIIMLTARSEDEDKLYGFELKVDEYVTKPFSPKVLVARAKMLLARTHGKVLEVSNDLIVEGIEINKSMRSVSIDSMEVELSPKEYDLLVYFLESGGAVLSREQILKNVWGYDYFGDVRAVDTHVKKLRKKLGDRSYIIKTIFSVGYKLVKS